MWKRRARASARWPSLFSLPAGLSAAVVALVACDDQRPSVEGHRPPPRVSATAPPSAATAMRVTDAGAVDEPPPLGGDLAADIAAFSTLDACVKDRGAFDAVLGDAVLALGYDTFVRDACRVLQAGKAKALEPCRAVTVTSLRRHCETVVATVAADPALCPDDPLSRGRDATCLAFARRDARACAAELEPRRIRCEAIVLGKSEHCAKAREGTLACSRDVARWRALVGVAKGSTAATSLATFRVTPTGRDGGSPARDGSLVPTLGRGVLVVVEGSSGRKRIDLGSHPEGAVLIGLREPALRMRVAVGGDGGATAVSATVALPGQTVSMPPAKGELAVRVAKLELEPGGAFELEAQGTLGDGAERVELLVGIKSFVRDVVDESALKRR